MIIITRSNHPNATNVFIIPETGKVIFFNKKRKKRKKRRWELLGQDRLV